jgi:hypothetical protein
LGHVNAGVTRRVSCTAGAPFAAVTVSVARTGVVGNPATVAKPYLPPVGTTLAEHAESGWSPVQVSSTDFDDENNDAVLHPNRPWHPSRP